MKKFNSLAICVFLLGSLTSLNAIGQCNTTQANTCACQTPGATNCDLLPDIMISWKALQNASGGPSEYAQTGTGETARLRITGSTPNVGHGPLVTMGYNDAGDYTFICGPDTIVTDDPNYACTNGYTKKQALYQRVYHKNGNVMTYTDYPRGTMTYHAGHGHQHVNDWTTMTLRLAQPGVSDAREWPIIASGGKVGYCLINLFNCSSAVDYCRTSHLQGEGSTITNSYFGSNYDLGYGTGSGGCDQSGQGIRVGNGDTYSENLDGMWINLLPGLCNGQYQIVAEVDPRNDFIEENDENNYTFIPFSLALQSPANSGGTANIDCDGRLVLGPGETRTLTASPGTAYAWSTGATTRSITVGSPGTYSCTVTCPCGSLSTPTLTLTSLAPPPPPVGTGATVIGPSTAVLGATGTNVRWYDAATGGNQVGAGNSWTTPVLAETTNYWAEDRTTSAGQNVVAGRTISATPTQGASNSSKQWLLFDANEPFKLVSFKVYASSAGQRHFVCVDRLGNMIAEKYIEIPSGLSTVTVNWNIPAGVQHKISAYDDSSEVTRNLWRNDAGTSYPYPIGTVGSITGSTAGSAYYFYLYDWVVQTSDVVAVSPRTMVTATVTNGVQVAAKVKLEGPFVSGTGFMNDDLRAASLIPISEPYSGLGFSQSAGGGGETVAASLFSTIGNNAIVDWVRMELRSSSDPTSIVATRQGLVQRDGDVVAVDGSSPLTFAVIPGSYYVVVRHRNHLGCMTASALPLTSAPTTVDFTLGSTPTWGSEARKNVAGTMVLWAGNVIPDTELKYTNSVNDREPILTAIGGVVPTATATGYLLADTNMDGVVLYTNAGNDRDVILVNIGGVVPTATRDEQLP